MHADPDALSDDELRAALRAAIEERNDAWARAQEADALAVELAVSRSMLEQMRSSISWRITSPIRSVKTALGQVRNAARKLRRLRRR